MTIKWMGAILIISCCAVVGFTLAAGQVREEKNLRQLIAALDFMACELQYRLTPLPQLCAMAARESSGCIFQVLDKLARELQRQILPGVKECMEAALEDAGDMPVRIGEAFQMMGSSLGRFDMEGQLQGLEAVRSHCRRELEDMNRGREERLRSYQTIGICTGAALAILFV